MQITLSLIKADVGSVGGHTQPTDDMLKAARDSVHKAIADGLLIDGFVSHTGDDIALLMSHTHGKENKEIHTFAWHTFLIATDFAHECGCYGAGQDLKSDAPSSNVRGAGPGVAEISFSFQEKVYRPAESFMMLAADKCGPGAFNLPLYLAFADPMYCSGLMLPKMSRGFSFEIVDMNEVDTRKTIVLNAPDDLYKIAMLLRDNERFGIAGIRSRTHDEQTVATSADHLHTIKDKVAGKDDPVALIRNQGIFPSPDEIISPFARAHYTGGGARGSHNMPLMPVALNTAATGMYSMPIVSGVGFSLQATGKFSNNSVDFFDNPAWDVAREHAQKKAIEMRNQGWSGPAMLHEKELEYGGYEKALCELLQQFRAKKE